MRRIIPDADSICQQKTPTYFDFLNLGGRLRSAGREPKRAQRDRQELEGPFVHDRVGPAARGGSRFFNLP